VSRGSKVVRVQSKVINSDTLFTSESEAGLPRSSIAMGRETSDFGPDAGTTTVLGYHSGQTLMESRLSPLMTPQQNV
jgi:hypothetical protein